MYFYKSLNKESGEKFTFYKVILVYNTESQNYVTVKDLLEITWLTWTHFPTKPLFCKIESSTFYQDRAIGDVPNFMSHGLKNCISSLKKKKAWTISILYFILVILSFMKIRDSFPGFPISSNLGLLPWGKRKQNSFKESHKLNIAAYRQHIIKKLTVRLKGKMNFNAFHSFLLSWGFANWVALIVNSLDLHLAGQAIPHSRGWGKCRASFAEVWCSGKVLCACRALTGLTFCVSHEALHLAFGIQISWASCVG